MKKWYFLFVMTLFLAIPCAARVIIVDANGTGDYPTIQAAINAANTGDIVELQPGTYTGDGNRDITFLGKAITLQSIDPNDPCVVDATVINCNGTESNPHRGFLFESGEGPNSVLSGVTITNGYAVFGGGIKCEGSGPRILNCTIRNNTKSGIDIHSGYACIIGCSIVSNVGSYGGGICQYEGNLKVSNCIISGNNSSYGGGIRCLNVNSLIENSTLVGNTAPFGGGISLNNRGTCIIKNCVLWDNRALESVPNPKSKQAGSQIIMTGCILTTSYSNIQGGEVDIYKKTTGATINWDVSNLDSDPCFAYSGYWVDRSDPNIIVEPNDPGAIWIDGNYQLRWNSPCVDIGDPNYITVPNETDFYGEPRIFNGRIDIGADEFNPQGPYIGISTPEMKFFTGKTVPAPYDQMFHIRNIGIETLNWSIAYDCNWLQITPSNGISMVEPNVVIVSVDASSVLPGDYYSCSLTVSDPCALNNPQTVNVRLIYGPEIELSADHFEFITSGNENPDDQTLIIHNSGADTLNCQITYNCDWLQVWPVVDPNEPNIGNFPQPNEITLNVDITGLNSGKYDCELIISDPCAYNSTQQVVVTLWYDCFPFDHPNLSYYQWTLVGKPECWCYPRQCLGDADGLPYGKSYYYVSIPDLIILKKAWNKYAQDLVGNEICADFDHLPYGKSGYRVSIPDLDILKANWCIGGGPAPGCLPGNRNP